MGELHDYWCARCGEDAPLTLRVMIVGLGDTAPSLKARVCNRVDCLADLLERHAARIRSMSSEARS